MPSESDHAQLLAIRNSPSSPNCLSMLFPFWILRTTRSPPIAPNHQTKVRPNHHAATHLHQHHLFFGAVYYNHERCKHSPSPILAWLQPPAPPNGLNSTAWLFFTRKSLSQSTFSLPASSPQRLAPSASNTHHEGPKLPILDDLYEALIRSKMAYLAGDLAKTDYLSNTIAMMMMGRRSFVIGRRSRLTG